MKRFGPWPSPVEWILLAGGLALVLRYLWILDDAFVYYRYVDNFLFLDRGLVFNEGELVEGYSSPAWLLLLIPLRLTGLDYWTLTAVLAVVSYLVFGWLLVRWNRSLSPGGPVVNLPLAFLSFSYGVGCYFSSGIETPLVQIAAVLFALFLLRPDSLALQIALAFSPLVRHEFALPWLFGLAWAWARLARFPVRLVAWTAALVGAWLGFRVIYYADLFPNTFYLKNDVWVSQGLAYVMETVTTYHLGWFALAVAALAWVVRRRTPPGYASHWAERGILLAAALAITAYVVKIGGDPRHYRYLAFPFVLFACACAGLAEAAIAVLAPRFRAVVAPGLAIAAASVAFSAVPPQLDRHPVTKAESHDRVNRIGDAAWHRHHPELVFHPKRREEDHARRDAYRRWSKAESRGYRQCVICVTAYLDMNARYVHRYGLTDAILARTDAKADLPAHKFSLAPRAAELVRFLRDAGEADALVYQRGVEAGTAPLFVVENLESVNVVARKIYNRHHPLENLRLALTFPPRIHVLPWEHDPDAAP